MSSRVLSIRDDEVIKQAVKMYQIELQELENGLRNRKLSRIEKEAIQEKITKHKYRIRELENELKPTSERMFEDYIRRNSEW